jgi:putative oxidoreductase
MKTKMIKVLEPVKLPLYGEILSFIPRFFGGLMLSLEFGSSKFGMPWSTTEELGLFHIASWFPEDVAKFGIPFVWAPWLFAWVAGAVEAIGGLLLAFGIGGRLVSALIGFTMLVAIFLQKWPDAMEYGSSWPLLPALGFLWISIYVFVLGSGRFSLDQIIVRNLKNK